MKIIVYGLGIIGASCCASLKRAGYSVYGTNRSPAPVEYALEHGFIDGSVGSFSGADVVIVAIPPYAAMRLLSEGDFPRGCIVSDVCGVKAPLERAVYSAPRSYRYVGMHPMAGKETNGIRSAEASLFDGKNLILTQCGATDGGALKTMRGLGEAMGFSRIVATSAEEHDRMIALTSQLAHVVSNAYIKSGSAPDCVGFTGGSFQDMTRIAPLDEAVWTELFFLNRENLSAELERLIGSLKGYLGALREGDGEKMRALLSEGKAYYRKFIEKKDDF